MRRTALTLFALLALGILAPVRAQNPLPVLAVTQTGALQSAPTPVATPVATPDAVVARLMSFDRNHDGLVAVSELPERMQNVLTRGTTPKTAGALDASAIRNMALHPAVPPVAVRGVQAGHYGFSDDTELDTRLHLNGAIDDLRLAKATRDQALTIGATFMDQHDAQARNEFLATVTPLLTEAQMVAVKTVLDQALPATSGAGAAKVDVVPAFGVATRSGQPVRVVRQSAIGSLLAHMDVAADRRRPLNAAVERLEERQRLSDTSRASLLEQMRGVLSDRERDDLRAALERRPIVKQGGTVANIIFASGNALPSPPRLPAGPQQFGMRDLVLR